MCFPGWMVPPLYSKLTMHLNLILNLPSKRKWVISVHNEYKKTKINENHTNSKVRSSLPSNQFHFNINKCKKSKVQWTTIYSNSKRVIQIIACEKQTMLPRKLMPPDDIKRHHYTEDVKWHNRTLQWISIWIKVCSCVQTLISLKDTSAVILLQVNNNQNDDILNCS